MSKQWRNPKNESYESYRRPSSGQPSHGHVPWRLWKGAQSPSQHRPRDGSAAVFPSYTQLQLQPEPTSVGPTMADGSEGTLQIMQRALTNAKKAEHRVRQINQQREKAVKLWEQYKLTLEQTYIKEHRRHQQDLQRLQKEMESALANQEHARASVRGAYHGEAEVPTEVDPQAKEAAAEWMGLRGKWEEVAKCEMDGVLQRAMSMDVNMATAPQSGPDCGPVSAPAQQRHLRREMLTQLFSEEEVQAILQATQPKMWAPGSPSLPGQAPFTTGPTMPGPCNAPMAAPCGKGTQQGSTGPSTLQTQPAAMRMDPYPPSPTLGGHPSFEIASPAAMPDSALRTAMHQQLGHGGPVLEPLPVPEYTKVTSPRPRVNPYETGRAEDLISAADQAARNQALQQRMAATRASLQPFRGAGQSSQASLSDATTTQVGQAKPCVINDDDDLDGLDRVTETEKLAFSFEGPPSVSAVPSGFWSPSVALPFSTSQDCPNSNCKRVQTCSDTALYERSQSDWYPILTFLLQAGPCNFAAFCSFESCRNAIQALPPANTSLLLRGICCQRTSPSATWHKLWAVLLLALPDLIWSTPPGLPELEDAGERAAALNRVREFPPMPDPMADAPGYQPEPLRFPLGIPCDVEDLLDEVGRRVVHTKLAFADRFVAVRPQPLPQVATVLVAPDWTAYGSVVAVCLDLRDTVPGSTGPVTSAYVTRTSCKSEICRQAGIYGARPCKVYIGTEPEPLEEDESIFLNTGCLITLVCRDVCPFYANDLAYRLQLPDTWPDPPLEPPSQPKPALLLLHHSGRFLFRPQASQLPIDEAAVRFVGIQRSQADLHVPAGEGCSHLQHLGVSVRGVIAVVDRNLLPPDQPQYLVFLDLRQLAHGVRFLVLTRPYIMRDELRRLANRQPPPAWRLRVLGGRMRRTKLEFQENETLVFGFEYHMDSDESEESFSPTTDEEDSDQEEDESSDSSAGDEALSQATTRHATATLGGDWPLTPIEIIQEQPQPADSPPTSEEEEDVAFKWVAVAVLKVGFAPEFLTVVLGFPGTDRELCQAVQAARHPEDARLFPHLFTALPQPAVGCFVLVANPAWHPQAVTVCVNTQQVDGRLFAANSMHYATRTQLLHLAGFTAASDLQVRAGDSPDTIAAEGSDNLFPGVTVSIFPPDVTLTQVPELEDLLTTGAHLQSERVLHTNVSDAYCVVWQDRHLIYEIDPRHPMRYRQDLAAQLGVDQSQLVLVPAAPRATDVEIQGRQCRTVLAAFLRSDFEGEPLAVGAIVDCRQLLSGWWGRICPRGLLDIGTLVTRLDAEAPLLWRTHVDGAPERFGHFQVDPGQLLKAEYIPADPQQPLPSEQHHTGAEVGGECGEQAQNVPVDLEADSWVPDLPADVFTADFFVYAQDFRPERVRVTLEAPGSLYHAHQAVNAGRDNASRRRAPRLLEVFPQPDPEFGLLIAVPSWSLPRVPALFDARLVGGGIFCCLSEPQTTRAALLRLAQVSSDAVRIFVQDQPWPLEDDLPVILSEGALVTIASTTVVTIQRATLPDMLLSHDRWAGQEHVPADAPLSLIVSPAGPAPFQLPLIDVHQTAADLLLANPSRVRTQLVTAPISGYCFKGHHVQEVTLAIAENRRPDMHDPELRSGYTL
ncbi:unnamed protein product [Symbiodinium sp. CCMP2592]|nr:unnamed protein product [Symbiodinium sp. CCMP2592]